MSSSPRKPLTRGQVMRQQAQHRDRKVTTNPFPDLDDNSRFPFDTGGDTTTTTEDTFESSLDTTLPVPSGQTSGSGGNNVLSPRRSSRLLHKHTTFQTEHKPVVVTDFAFFKNTTSDTTSDYGSSSTTHSKLNVSSSLSDDALSDDLSNMSLDEFNQSPPPLPPNQSQNQSQNQNQNNVTTDILPPPRVHPQVNPQTPAIYLKSTKDFHFLIPNSNATPSILKSGQMTNSIINYFEKLDTSMIIVTNPFLIKIPNYPQSILNSPLLVAVPFVNISPPCYSIYKHFNNQWKSISQNKTLNNQQKHATFHFETDTYYCLVYKNQPVININKNNSNFLKACEYPLVTIKFQKNNNNQIKSTCYFDQTDLNKQIINRPLAAPLLELTPHGVTFEKPVTITFEIIDYFKIIDTFHNPKLIIFQSEDSFHWRQIDQYHIENNHISFEVKHFSFFKVVWDLLAGSLAQAKLGLSNIIKTTYHHPMKCQSTMNEYSANRFGLEINIYNAEKNFPEIQNYSHIVGRSLTKLIKPGKLTVLLKSNLFSADIDAGEEFEMIKNIDFIGGDINIDFALKFNDGLSLKNGPFGKVIVSYFTNNNDDKKENVFEFNVQKHGNETENHTIIESDGNRWSIIAIEELANSLFITENQNWKLFASKIGFTKLEIKNKFTDSADPFRSILESYKTRGGTPEEFIKCLYEIHREIKINPALLSGDNSPRSSNDLRKSPGSSTNSSGLGSSMSNHHKQYSQKNYYYDEQDEEEFSNASSPDGKSDSLLSHPHHQPHPHCSKRKPVASSSTSSRLRSAKRRKKTSDNQAESNSSNDDDEEGQPNKSIVSSNTSLHNRSDTTRLDSRFLWDISRYLTNNMWKALGRTLDLEESYLINIEQLARADGNRECYYQVLSAWKEHFPKQCTFRNLYAALVKENMVAVAKKMNEVKLNLKT